MIEFSRIAWTKTAAPESRTFLILWLPLLFLLGLVVPPLLLLLTWVLSSILAVAPAAPKRPVFFIPPYVRETAPPRSPPV